MRTEQEMYQLILKRAEKDENIRAVILNGSRANPNVKKDPFQDFDIVYLVRDLKEYKEKEIWRDFGDILVMARTDENEFSGEFFEDFVCYLMQFKDGNRIDLTIADILNYYGYCFDDRLSVILLDKDGTLPKLPKPDESTHFVKAPNPRTFRECMTEFWWTALYVSKGLWRGQICYAQEHMETCVREKLRHMLAWHAGSVHGFDYTAGKAGDYLPRYVSGEIWETYLLTYSDAKEENIWKSLKIATQLFESICEETAENMGFSYDKTRAKQVCAFIDYTKNLPRDGEKLLPLESGIYEKTEENV